MNRIAIYPGSFDPPTRGHEDLIRRALGMFDRLIVAVAVNPNKDPLLSVEERLQLLRDALGPEPRIELASFSGLLADFARARESTIVLKAIRQLRDWKYPLSSASGIPAVIKMLPYSPDTMLLMMMM